MKTLPFFFAAGVALISVAAATAPGAQAATVSIASGADPTFGTFVPSAGDVFGIDAGSFGVTAPLRFASGIFGDPGRSAANLPASVDDPAAIGSDANVVVIRNHDDDDADGTRPANWSASWNARTALQAIAANTSGDRAGFFLYWNEGHGVNRLFAATNLNDSASAISLLFVDQSSVLTGVPGEFDLNLANGDPTRTDLFGEANGNLAELEQYTAGNFAFTDQPAPVPLPAALPMLLAALGGFRLFKRRRDRRVVLPA